MTMLRSVPGRDATLGLACLLLGLLLFAAPAAAAPTWLPPQDLSAPLRSANNVHVVIGGSGENIAVWERQEDKGIAQIIQVASRAPGEAFSAPVDLGAGQQPQIAMSQGGEAVLAWWRFKQIPVEPPGLPIGFYALMASLRHPGGGFSAPTEIAQLEPNTGSPPQVQLDMNDAGDAVLAWMRREPKPDPETDVRTIEAATRPAGGVFSAPETISKEGDDANQPAAAVDGSGDVIAVWAVREEIGEEIAFSPQAAVGHVGGGFSSPPGILPADRERATGLDVGVSFAGEATVVWEGSEIPKEDEEGPLPVNPPVIESVSGQLPGPFSGPVALSDEARVSFDPIVKVNAGGEAVAVWTFVNETEDQIIQASTKPPGGAFPGSSGVVDLTAPTAGNANRPALSLNDSGVAMAVWEQGSPSVVRASIREPGGSFSPGVPISVPGADALFPDVAVAPSGDAVAAWKRSNGANFIAQAAGLDANPPFFRSVSIPAHGTVGVPVAFSADPFDVWPIVSTTFAFGDGTGAAGRSVSHVYGSAGVYPVTVTATDAAGNPVSAATTISIAPQRAWIRLGKRRRNRKKGTILVTVRVSGPGRVILRGRGVKRQQKRARSGRVKLLVVANGKTQRRLSRKGKVKVRPAFVFRPDNGAANVRRKPVLVLVKKQGQNRRSRGNR